MKGVYYISLYRNKVRPFVGESEGDTILVKLADGDKLSFKFVGPKTIIGRGELKKLN